MKVSHSSFKAEVEPKMADPEPGSNVSRVGRDDHLEAVGSRTGKLITCQNGAQLWENTFLNTFPLYAP